MARYTWLTALLCLLSGCTGIPEGVSTIKQFQVEAYMGTWYEIARLDHSFERGLEQVSAHYELQEDGTVKVTNRGFEPQEGKWKEAIGKAKLNGEPGEGRLKVSFFGPFYGAYNILELGQAYDYAVICGPDRDYLWILARTPTLPTTTLEPILGRLKAMGFATEQLIFVRQK